MTQVSERVDALLRGVPHHVLDHVATHTAEDAARARGTSIQEGGKALVMKVKGMGFVVLALRGSDVLDNKLFRRHLGVQRFRFASRDELMALTGLVPGCVPPLGRPVFDLPLFVDAALADSPRLAFTTGFHTRSIRMSTADWLFVAKPDDTWSFAKPK
jgi:prolyl-tRNA editing enzyme YbaK/EbsC (Cys-tRNA(Pro) deacylase)